MPLHSEGVLRSTTEGLTSAMLPVMSASTVAMWQLSKHEGPQHGPQIAGLSLKGLRWTQGELLRASKKDKY